MSRARATPAARLDPAAAASLFAALGDSTRLAVLVRLARAGPGSIAQLSAEAAVSRQAVSKHLRVLSDAGLVAGLRQGREHVWALQPRRFDEARAYLDSVAREWDDALLRLKHFVDR